VKKFVTILGGLMLVAATAYAAGPGPFYVPGDYQTPNWSFGAFNLMTANGGGAGVWTAAITSDAAAGFHTHKVSVDGWSENYPCCNVPVVCNTGDVVNFSFDTNSYADGWVPSTNIVWNDHLYAAGTQFEVIGSAPETGNWNSGVAAGLVGTVWTKTLTIAAPGPYEFKFRVVGQWGVCDAGSDGPTAGGGGNGSYTTSTANTDVKFEFNSATGRIRATLLAPTPTNTKSWGHLKSTYR
jgi:hypothetical protein